MRAATRLGATTARMETAETVMAAMGCWLLAFVKWRGRLIRRISQRRIDLKDLHRIRRCDWLEIS